MNTVTGVHVDVKEHCDDVNSFRNVDELLLEHEKTLAILPLRNAGFVTLEAKRISSVDAAAAAPVTIMGEVMESVFASDRIPPLCRRLTASPQLLYWKVAVTPQGVAAGIPENGGYFELQKRVMDEITGISTEPDGTATVEFVFVSVPTEFGKRVGERATPVAAKAVLKRYDDGWRVVSVTSARD